MHHSLEGITVVELGHVIAGPMATYQLVTFGAEVIKVERPPIGDGLRAYVEHGAEDGISLPFAAYNAGKRSVVLDLSDPPDLDALNELIARADVFVTNFRAKSIDKLGLGWEALRAKNPWLIHCQISGFGETGPLQEWPAYDHIIQALSGIMSLNGEGGQPSRVALAIIDIFAGQIASGAITAALVERERTGEGQHIDVSMLDAALVMLGPAASTYLHTGEEPRRVGNTGFRPSATTDTYECADGHLTLGCSAGHQFVRLCKVLGMAELATDPRFETSSARLANREELKQILADRLRPASASALEAELIAADVPAVRVRTVGEILDHPYVAERGVMVDAAMPGGAPPVPVVGAAFHSTSTGSPLDAPGALRVPALGEHSAEVFAELGRDVPAAAETGADADGAGS